MADLAIGLMSGTSCDGISAALVRFQDRSFTVLAERTVPYPNRVRDLLRQAPSLPVHTVSSLHMALGERFADAALRVLRQARVSPRRVRVIGSHGHTIYHGPTDRVASTLQIGQPAVIAHRTGISVVADFRARDMAAGGEGAPLVPMFDHVFFGGGPARALLNLGGIANVTIVGRGIRPLAFDTGPGNCLIDLAAERATQGRRRFDRNGRLALRGRIDFDAIRRGVRHPYFRRPPPKSTGRELFNDRWLAELCGRGLARRPLDALATVTYLTSSTVRESFARFVPQRISEIIVSGGGAYNHTLMRQLASSLHPVPVHPITRYGITPLAKEPVAFAFLALRAIQGRPNHLPWTTGAHRACALGALIPGGGA